MPTPGNDLNITEAGFVTFDGTATFNGRTLQEGTGITITNADGTAGDPTISVTSNTYVTGTGTDNHIVRWDGTGVPAIQDSDPVITDAGVIQIVDGAVGAPGVSFKTDTTTGIYLIASNVLGIAVGGQQLFRISTSPKTTQVAGGMSFQLSTTAISASLDTKGMILGVTAVPVTITLTQFPNAGSIFVIKDQSGSASVANPITIQVSGGVKTIDGATSYALNTPYGSITVYGNSSGNYFII